MLQLSNISQVWRGTDRNCDLTSEAVKCGSADSCCVICGLPPADHQPVTLQGRGLNLSALLVLLPRCRLCLEPLASGPGPRLLLASLTVAGAPQTAGAKV